MLNLATVGVTGHRNLCEEDLQQIAEEIASVLRVISQQNSTHQCILWTGLAEGADQFAAYCAWQSGWQVGAVLALPVEEFEQDFSELTARQEFRDMLQRCSQVHVASASGTPRPACYAAVGEWLCLQSETLLALWDGDLRTATRPGGTAWVIQRFQQMRGVPSTDTSANSHHSSDLRGRLIHIPVRRAASNLHQVFAS